ncbi:MAG: hypothetical protein HYW48_11990, partial [Deltaproteobacteria bacterium]|nr:hypothetical protein [Deltaproteobacteria bacterium]
RGHKGRRFNQAGCLFCTVIPRLDRGIQRGSLPRTSWIPRSSRGMTEGFIIENKEIAWATTESQFQTVKTT